MTATAHTAGPFRHELVLYDGVAELLDLMRPFVREGAAAGDEVVVVGQPDFVEALLASVPEVSATHVVAEPGRGRYPGRDLHQFERLLAQRHETASRVRVANQMPPMTTAQWYEWRRYEAAANVVLAPYRAWGTCAYDTRVLDAGMLDDLTASHPFIRTSAGSRRSADVDELDARSRHYLEVPPHPAERLEPTLSLVGPTAAVARRAVHDLAIAAGLSPTAQESVVLATSEAVTNGWTHGRPPVEVRVWADRPGEVTVAVSDAGPGPDPLVGLLLAPPDSSSGRGMWMVHLILGDIHHRTSPDGYTMTFTVDGHRAGDHAGRGSSGS
jgi:anti-sigma regulatory factor (Ser/Thr protein kinase)